MFKIKLKKNSGESIVETVFYIALFAVLSIAIINALIVMMKSFKETSAWREMVQNGAIMETMSREIKKAYNISSIISTDLVLDTRDEAGNNRTVEFVLSGTDILFRENGSLVGNLNSTNISVSNLSFTQITTTKGSVVKISFSIAPKSGVINAENIYDTIVMRGNY